MNRNITRYNSIKKLKKEAISMKKSIFGPNDKTMEFIRQFARVYHFEPALDHTLGSFIVN